MLNWLLLVDCWMVVAAKKSRFRFDPPLRTNLSVESPRAPTEGAVKASSKSIVYGGRCSLLGYIKNFSLHFLF